MSAKVIGYEFLLEQIPLRMPPLASPARVTSVTRIEASATQLSVPRHVAPRNGASVLEHALFALKHEAMQLAILHESLKLVPIAEMSRALANQPTSANLRRAAFIWEKSNDTEIPLPGSTTGGNYVDMFDAEAYYTGETWERNARLRVNFNGIGPYSYCPVVRRDAALESEGARVLEELKLWATNPANEHYLERVMNWAYLSETRDSWAIENEVPSPPKERAFLYALEQLKDRDPLTEDYLVGLQNMLISEPRAAEQQFRDHQNWLQRGGHGAASVRYVPPPFGPMLEMMDGLMKMANSTHPLPPFIKAALVSFSFVFMHPFMDGNGRLSRLLAHHSLNYGGVLPDVRGNPAILPLSVAMKKDENGYLAALEAFSKPARALWDVVYVDGSDFHFDFRSSHMVYASWSGDHAAKFLTQCARAALENSLLDEANYIVAYDQSFEKIDKIFELPNRTVNLLIQWIQQNNCKIPERRRNAQELFALKPEQIDRIEEIVAEFFDPIQADKRNRTPPAP